MNKQKLYELSKELCGEDTIKDEIDKTYNKLLNLYNGIVKIGFEINCFSIKEQSTFLIEMLNVKESDEDFFSNKASSKKFPNRRLIDNLQKDDMELDKEKLMDFFIEKGILDSTFKPNLLSFKDVAGINRRNKTMIRQKIRTSEDEYANSYKELYMAFINYAHSADVEFNQFEKMGIKNLKQEILVTDLIEEGLTYLFLQSIMYQIIKNTDIKKEQRLKYLSDIEKALEKTNNNDDFACTLEYENIFDSFAAYLFKVSKRDLMVNYIDVITVLENEMENRSDLFIDVQEQYQCNERWLRDIESKKELINIVLEGKQEKVERFNEKMEICKMTICILKIFAGRDLYADYLQHFKAAYREIFLSKVKSGEKDGKNASTIVKHMINMFKEEGHENSLKNVDSIFLQEKVSRGLFREDGLLEEYIIKNKIQRHLYTVLLKIYTSTDVKCQRENIQIFFEIAYKQMMNILSEIDKLRS